MQQAVQRINTEKGAARGLDYEIVALYGDKSVRESLEAEFKAFNDQLPTGGCNAFAAWQGPVLCQFTALRPPGPLPGRRIPSLAR